MQERHNSIANALELHCCKKDVTPLLTHWSYVFLALTHRHIWLSMSLPLWPIWPWHEGSGQFHSNTMTILLRICNLARENKTLGSVAIKKLILNSNLVKFCWLITLFLSCSIFFFDYTYTFLCFHFIFLNLLFFFSSIILKCLQCLCHALCKISKWLHYWNEYHRFYILA